MYDGETLSSQRPGESTHGDDWAAGQIAKRKRRNSETTGRGAGKRNGTINLAGRYLRCILLDRSKVGDAAAYPVCVPFLARDFELGLDRTITIGVGENGAGNRPCLRNHSARWSPTAAGNAPSRAYAQSRETICPARAFCRARMPFRSC